MDMSISIRDNTKFKIDLYKKPLNLYLYISSLLAHPPGMITGLVFGMILGLWLWKLWSRVSDIKRRIKIFYRCLIRRGYSKDTLILLLTKATENACQHLRRTPQQLCAIQDRKLIQGYRRIFFHLQYHCNDPNSKIIQNSKGMAGAGPFTCREALSKLV
jgi:hypothetical protein